MAKVLVCSDTHLPVAHPQYLRFVKDLRDKYKCDTIMHGGDLVDWSAISFHAKNPDAPGPKDEYQLTLKSLKPWKEAFPKMLICIGNHDNRIKRVAENSGIPSSFIKDDEEIWDTVGWKWADRHYIDDVCFFHGTGCGGIHPSWNAMNKTHQNTCIGHCHSSSGIKWMANPVTRHFAADIGCGVDDDAYAFVYGRHLLKKSILSAMVVLDGTPIHHIMECGPGERYHARKR